MSSSTVEPAFGGFPYGRLAFALALGFGGAIVFRLLSLPLPWMLGSLTACLLGSLLKFPIAAPGSIRPPMLMLVGVLLGSGFSPNLLSGLWLWAPSLACIILFVLIGGSLCFFYFRRVAGFDVPTAYFSGMPGGMIEMVALGEAQGGDPRRIALVQSSRIMLTVLLIPAVLTLATGVIVARSQSAGVSIVQAPLMSELWLLVTGLVGIALGRRMRLPSPYLMGPMLASAAVHLSGLTDFRPAVEIVAFAQVALGSVLGCSFAGTRPRDILAVLGISLGSTLLLVSLGAAFAFALAAATGIPLLALLLAYSPGGLTETSLMALVLNVEVAFVATHHVLRVFFITVSAAAFFRAFDRKNSG